MLVDINDVAADQRELIAAFRAAGSKSYQDAGSVAKARENYEVSCSANGFSSVDIETVFDVTPDTNTPDFTLRVYDNRAGDKSAAATIIYFHGGGWVIGSLETHDTVCRQLAKLTNLPVIAVNYRLGNENVFPAGHDDCVHAIEWVRDNAATGGFDPQKLITIGDSAGGGLATVCAALPEMQAQHTRVIAQIPLYPMLDITNSSNFWQRIDAGFGLTEQTLTWFVDNYVPDRDMRADRRVSPLLALRAQAATTGDHKETAADALLKQPPMLMVTLGHDPLAAEALEYAHLAALGGTHVELLHLPQHAHGIMTQAAQVHTATKVLQRAAEFILAHAQH